MRYFLKYEMSLKICLHLATPTKQVLPFISTFNVLKSFSFKFNSINYLSLKYIRELDISKHLNAYSSIKTKGRGLPFIVQWLSTAASSGGAWVLKSGTTDPDAVWRSWVKKTNKIPKTSRKLGSLGDMSFFKFRGHSTTVI